MSSMTVGVGAVRTRVSIQGYSEIGFMVERAFVMSSSYLASFSLRSFLVRGTVLEVKGV